MTSIARAYQFRFAAVLAAALLACACAPLPVVEATIPELQAAMRDGRTDSRELVGRYLARIARYDDELNAVMALNPGALADAARLDTERAAGRVRGPLHGIPLALKDIINTTDMPTTGGALAFAGYTPPYEAELVTQLREAGAVIIAKTVNTELANWVAAGMPGNYSALGGQGVNPYGADLAAGGSSSGIGTAVSFWAASVGTETSGSILNPSNATGLVGVKPTVGLVSQHGIMPITADQDVAGPMARSVVDAAIVLGAIVDDDGTCALPPRHDYTAALAADDLAGARIGVPRAFYYDALEPAAQAALDRAVAVLRARGATVIDADIPSLAEFQAWPVCAGHDDAKGHDADCSVVLKYGMKRDFNAYLDTLGAGAPVQSLTELRAFNLAHAADGAIRYGQAQLDISDQMDVAANRARYLADRAKDVRIAGTDGIDAALAAHDLDALLFAKSRGAPLAARPGYPSVIVPFGLVDGAPFGVTFTGTACSDQRLLEFAYAFEQATQARVPPPGFD